MNSLEKSIFIAAFLSSKASFALHAGDDEFKSPAARAVRFQKVPTYWMDQRFGFLDGVVSNDQTESKRYDRRVAYGLAVGVEHPISAAFSLRIDARTEVVKRRQIDNSVPNTTSDETNLTFRPLAAATYITPAGLELFGGVVANMQPAYTQTVAAGSDKTTIKYAGVQYFAPHVGLTRRGGFGAGGIYYQFGKDQKRNVTKSAADGTILEMSETKQEPTTLGVFAQFSGLGGSWRMEGAAVSEGEGGERSESGDAVRDDHLELSLASVWGNRFDLGASYQTARYSKSAYMEIDSIPMGSVHAYLISDDQSQHIFVGAILAAGRDKQSIPEMNARYEVNAVSLVGGINGNF